MRTIKWSVQLKAANREQWEDVTERGGIVLARRNAISSYALARRERRRMRLLYPTARLRVRPVRVMG
jgi:hypothetical protein